MLLLHIINLPDTWLRSNNKQTEGAVGDDATVAYEGSGSGSGDGPPASSGRYPPDDEDAYTSGKGDDTFPGYDDDEDIYTYNKNRGKGNHNNHAYEGSGGGWDEDMEDDFEGSGGYVPKPQRPVYGSKPPRKPQEPPSQTPKNDVEQPPSGASKGETMSLKRAITIYMLPAIIMFLGSLA